MYNQPDRGEEVLYSSGRSNACQCGGTMQEIQVIPGLDERARALIGTYWTALCPFFEKQIVPRLLDTTIDLWRDHQALQEPFDTLKKDVTKADAKDSTA